MARITLRRAKTAEWYAFDPILRQGEPGYDLDTGELRIGNGTDPWSELSAITGGEPVGGGGLPYTTDEELTGIALHFGYGPLPPASEMPNTLYILVPTPAAEPDQSPPVAANASGVLTLVATGGAGMISTGPASALASLVLTGLATAVAQAPPTPPSSAGLGLGPLGTTPLGA
jgi:hypothetical protein